MSKYVLAYLKRQITYFLHLKTFLNYEILILSVNSLELKYFSWDVLDQREEENVGFVTIVI